MKTPSGWALSGEAPRDYEVELRPSERHEGRMMLLRSRTSSAHEFGTVSQFFGAERYRGKRLRFAGSLRTESVSEWAGLWMRVDGPERNQTLVLDNMQRRAPRGTTAWARYEIVLDVAPEARLVALGVLLAGEGSVFADELTFEEVSKDVPTTDAPDMWASLEPRNLDFATD